MQKQVTVLQQASPEYSNEIVNVKTSLPKRPMTTANPNVNKKDM